MSFFYDHLKAHVEAMGLSLHKLQFMVEIPAAQFSLWKSGKRYPTEMEIKKLAAGKDLGLSEELLKSWKALDLFGPKAIQLAHQELQEQDLNYLGAPQGFYRFPCVGKVSAGSLEMSSITEDVVYYEFSDIQEYDPTMFCLEIQGDSMEPEFKDGGIILVREAKHFRNNGFYVLRTDQGKSTFKVLRFEQDGQPRLVPINPKHKPIPLEKVNIQYAYEVLEYKKSYI